MEEVTYEVCKKVNLVVHDGYKLPEYDYTQRSTTKNF